MRFRKKPMEIEAFQWDGTFEALETMLHWLEIDIRLCYPPSRGTG